MLRHGSAQMASHGWTRCGRSLVLTVSLDVMGTLGSAYSEILGCFLAQGPRMGLQLHLEPLHEESLGFWSWPSQLPLQHHPS